MVMASMAKFSFTHNQKQEVLSKLNAGRSAKVVSHEHGVSVRTLYRWRANMNRKQRVVRESERLRSLEAEHQRLKKRFAELVLDYTTLRAALVKDVIGDC
jgi:putative transposase